MSELLEGAYVQAWVWVSVDDLVDRGATAPVGHNLNADECNPYCRDQGEHVLDIMDDEIVRDKARELFNDEGVIEVDDNAPVSRVAWTDSGEVSR